MTSSFPLISTSPAASASLARLDRLYSTGGSDGGSDGGSIDESDSSGTCNHDNGGETSIRSDDDDNYHTVESSLSMSFSDNKNNVRDQVVSVMSDDGGIKVTVCTVRNMINDAMVKHTLTAVPADALARTAICALLMANGIQAEQTVQITVNADGPLRGIVAIATGTGGVRGYVGSPMLGRMPLEAAVGKRGSVQIVKNHPDWPRPYNGITAVRHGDIDRDVGLYLAESEQRSCALAAGTVVEGILCTAAGGYLVEQLPGVDPETVRIVERNLAKLVERDDEAANDYGDENGQLGGGGDGNAVPTGFLRSGKTPVDIAAAILDGLGTPRPLQEIEPVLSCQCSDERLFRSLRLLPRQEVEEILEKEERIEARCQFCGKVYRIDGDELRERLERATGDPSRD